MRGRFGRRLFGMTRRERERIDADVDDEIAFHLEQRTTELMRQGLDPDSARERAAREFGDIDVARRALAMDDTRLARRAARRAWLDELRQDLRFAVRALRRRPGFALAAAFTLALGIGATTLVFTVVNGILLRPLPYAEPDRIVKLWQTNEAWRGSENPVMRAFAERFPASYPVAEDWGTLVRAFSAVGAYDGDAMTVTGGGRPERLAAVQATAGLFDVLGIAPALGRTPMASEDRPGGPALVVLSHGYWQRRFGGAADVVGRTLVLDGRPHTVLGVMPPGFYFPRPDVEVWATLDDEVRRSDRSTQGLQAVARLAPGVDLETARRDLAAVTAGMQETNPETQAEIGSRLVPLLDEVVPGGTRRSLLILLGATGLVLLVACANVVNLLLVRATGRAHELAVRAALGAGRFRLARTLLSESIVLGLLGGMCGIGAALTLLDPLVALLPSAMPRTNGIAIDHRVLGFGVAATIGAALFAGVAPALVAARTPVGAVMRDAARGLVGARAAGRTRGVLVVAELTLAFLLLVAAGLLGRSLARLTSVDPGIDAAGLIVTRLDPLADSEPEPTAALALFDRIRDRIGALPGVEVVAYAEDVPFFGGNSAGAVEIEDLPAEASNVGQAVVSDGYFEALRIPVRRGRAFSAADRDGAMPVAVVSSSMAERFWPGTDAIGKRVRDGGESEWRVIVGVVEDVRPGSLAEDPVPLLYLPAAQRPGLDDNSAVFAVRATGELDALAPAIRSAIWDIAPDLPIPTVARLAELVSRSISSPRFLTLLIGSLASLAATLAVFGVYALVAYSVARRTTEIGVRMALGASGVRVVGAVVARGLAFGLIAVAIGVPAAVLAMRPLEDFLFEVTTLDAAAFGVAALLVAGTAAFAAYVPARRAARVDPMVALRAE